MEIDDEACTTSLASVYLKLELRPQKQGGVAHGSFESDPDLDVAVMLANCSVNTRVIVRLVIDVSSLTPEACPGFLVCFPLPISARC
jgi:hypothetical protein